MRIVVLGIGNVLLSDEGVGVHAVEALQARYRLPDSVDVVDGGTAGMELIRHVGGADCLIVVDCVRVGQPPGSVVVLQDDEIGAFFKTKLSPHQVGLSDLLATAALLGEKPGRVVLVGVQPVSLETAMQLSPEVEGRMDAVLDAVVAELRRHDLAVAAA